MDLEKNDLTVKPDESTVQAASALHSDSYETAQASFGARESVYRQDSAPKNQESSYHWTDSILPLAAGIGLGAIQKRAGMPLLSAEVLGLSAMKSYLTSSEQDNITSILKDTATTALSVGVGLAAYRMYNPRNLPMASESMKIPVLDGSELSSSWARMREFSRFSSEASLFEAKRPAVVKLENVGRLPYTGTSERNWSTGFLIDSEGRITTSLAGVIGQNRINARTADNKLYSAVLEKADPQSGLAILRLENTGGRAFPFIEVPETSAMFYRKPITIGFSDHSPEAQISQGNYSGLTALPKALFAPYSKEMEPFFRAGTKLDTYSPMKTNDGFIGAPIFRKGDGRLIGVVQAGKDGLYIGTDKTFAVSGDRLYQLLRDIKDKK